MTAGSGLFDQALRFGDLEWMTYEQLRAAVAGASGDPATNARRWTEVRRECKRLAGDAIERSEFGVTRDGSLWPTMARRTSS